MYAGPTENQFQLFGLTLGKYMQYINNVQGIDLGVCKLNLDDPIARRCGLLLCRSFEDLVHVYYLIIHIVTALHGLAAVAPQAQTAIRMVYPGSRGGIPQ